MIIKTNKVFENNIVKAEFEGKNLKVLHAQNITPILEAAYEERKESIGQGRQLIGDKMERIATVPSIVFAEHPEFLHDDKAFRKWLKGDGACYRTSTRSI